MTIEIALALLAISAPITAAIITRERQHVEDCVSLREYDKFRGDIGDALTDLRVRTKNIEDRLQELSVIVKSHWG